MSKRITVKEINNLIWGNKWQGSPDPTALRERLRSLMLAEKQLDELNSKISATRSLLSNFLGI